MAYGGGGLYPTLGSPDGSGRSSSSLYGCGPSSSSLYPTLDASSPARPGRTTEQAKVADAAERRHGSASMYPDSSFTSTPPSPASTSARAHTSAPTSTSAVAPQPMNHYESSSLRYCENNPAQPWEPPQRGSPHMQHTLPRERPEPQPQRAYPPPAPIAHVPERRIRPKASASDPSLGRNTTASPRGLVGLDNMGNTCFMNTAVQCLSNTLLVRNYFLSGKFETHLNRAAPKTQGRLAEAFGALVKALWLNDGHIAPKEFKTQVSRVADQFQGFNQQDLQEFLRYLLDGLHEDLNVVRVKPPYRELSDDPRIPDSVRAEEAWEAYRAHSLSRITDIFAGQLGSTVTCRVCGHKSKAFDPFMDLSVPLPKRRCTLQDCLQEFTKREVLEGDDEVYCSACKAHRPSVKRLQIFTLPVVLVIHLKRFRFHGRYGEQSSRLDTHVDLPLRDLDLSAFVSGRQPQPLVYDLVAVANHYGTLQGGHYTAQCYSVEKKMWYLYDDSRVRPCDPPTGGAAPYVLFYQRR